MAQAHENRLTIDFTGLCVLVTNAPAKQLKVMLACDAGKKRMAMGPGMAHRPLLSFDVKYFSLFTGATPMQVMQLPNGDQIASWDLSDRILRLKEWHHAYPENVVVCRGDGDLPTCPPDPAAEMDARWIPSMGVVSGSSEILPEYLTDDPRPAKGDTALRARFDCEAGYLYSNFEVNRRSPMQPWSFGTAKGSPRQYLADTARLELKAVWAEDEPVIFEAFAFGAGRKSYAERLELMPRDGRIEVSITNLPETLPMGPPPQDMKHFEILYRLLKNPKRQPIPTMSKDDPCDMKAILARSARKGAASRAPRPGTGPTISGGGGVLNARPFGIAPVKCTPGMVP